MLNLIGWQKNVEKRIKMLYNYERMSKEIMK